jgi:hypothetical protein
MVLPYHRFKDKSTHTCVHRPMLDVILWNGARNVSMLGLLDSGADGILVNKSIAKVFDVDVKKLPMLPSMGINGTPTKTWKYELEVEVPNLPNSKRKMEIRFIDSPSVGILLGRKDFFDSYMIKFEGYALMFEIDFPKYT